MNDRFKFRCFNKFENKMFDVRSMSYINGVVKRIEVQSEKGILIFDEWERNIDNTVLMQCTGLKDKNGKLIYEGDILKINETSRLVVVRFKGISFELFAKPTNLVGYHNDKYIPEDCEIVGNIYENKE